jgi:hypothetical protein
VTGQYVLEAGVIDLGRDVAEEGPRLAVRGDDTRVQHRAHARPGAKVGGALGPVDIAPPHQVLHSKETIAVEKTNIANKFRRPSRGNLDFNRSLQL